MLGNMYGCVESRDRVQIWRMATISFTLTQTGGAYLFSYVLARSGNYFQIFILGGAALVLGLIFHLLSPRPCQLTKSWNAPN